MTSRGPIARTSGRTTYEIVVRGELSELFVSTFLSEIFGSTARRRRVDPEDGTTAIGTEVIDQAQLLAILESLRDFDLEIERLSPTHEGERNAR